MSSLKLQDVVDVVSFYEYLVATLKSVESLETTLPDAILALEALNIEAGKKGIPCLIATSIVDSLRGTDSHEDENDPEDDYSESYNDDES